MVYMSLYLLSTLSFDHGIPRPAFITNASSAPIALTIPASWKHICRSDVLVHFEEGQKTPPGSLFFGFFCICMHRRLMVLALAVLIGVQARVMCINVRVQACLFMMVS